jgi:hypothetical protein
MWLFEGCCLRIGDIILNEGFLLSHGIVGARCIVPLRDIWLMNIC